MFHTLPEDLIVVLIADWVQVGLAGLSRLDVACCNRSSRGCFRHIASIVRIREDKARKQISNMLTWLHSRRVCLELFSVGARIARSLDQAEHAVLTDALEVNAKALKVVPCPVTGVSFKICHLLSYFPNLTAMDWGDCDLSDAQLFEMAAMRYSLRSLSLRLCKNLSVRAIAEIVASAKDSIEQLHCEGIDDWLMLALADHCTNLRQLTCCSIDKLEVTSMMAFCASNPHLSHVTIDGPAVTNDMVAVMLTARSLMKEIHIGTRSAATLDVLEFITGNDSGYENKLTQFTLSGTVIKFFPSSSSSNSSSNKGYCEVTVKHRGELFASRSSLRHLRTPLHHILHSRGDCGIISSNELRLLADLHGHTLEYASLMPGDSVQRSDVQYFLMHCPHLRTLFFSTEHEDVDLLSDEDVRNLPTWCPDINRFGFIDCAPGLTDDALIYALSKWSPNNIDKINLYGCRLVTDKALTAIQQYCPNIGALYVWRTAISKEALLDTMLALSENRALYEVAPPDVQSKVWITAQMRKHKWILRNVRLFQP